MTICVFRFVSIMKILVIMTTSYWVVRDEISFWTEFIVFVYRANPSVVSNFQHAMEHAKEDNTNMNIHTRRRQEQHRHTSVLTGNFKMFNFTKVLYYCIKMGCTFGKRNCNNVSLSIKIYLFNNNFEHSN